MPNKKPFSVSLKVIALDDQGRCLLLRRSANSRGNPGKWEFPGGKIDPGESFDEGLLREVAEETGLTLSLERVVGATESEMPERKVAYLIMEGHVESGIVCLSDEHDDCMWINVCDLPKQDLSPQFREFAHMYALRTSSDH